MATLEAEGIEPIDLVCVNLYPFEQHGGAPRRHRGRGGREHRHRRPDDDPRRGQEPPRRSPSWSSRRATTRCWPSSRSRRRDLEETRHWLANEAFALHRRATTPRSAAGSGCATRRSRALGDARTRSSSTFPTARTRTRGPRCTWRSGARSHVLSRVAKLHGAPLSFNNVLDLDSARSCCDEFDEPACVIVKHNNPCGAAIARRPSTRLTRRRSPATRCRRSAA